MRYPFVAAQFAPFVLLASASLGALPGSAHAAFVCDDGMLCVSPGRVAFAMAPNGAWKFFGPLNDGSFLEKGGVVVYALSDDGVPVEIMNASGGVRSLLSDPIDPVKEGVTGGARDPFPRPDDDNDGRVDEDPLDRADNDRDGRIDEDFAAIGDEMAVALYGPKGDLGLEIRQEWYAWSLPHIDGMVATAISVRAGGAALEGVRVGVVVEPEGGFESEPAPLIEADRRGTSPRMPAGETLVWRDGGLGMALLLWAPTGDGDDWEIREDRKRTRAISPSLGRLAPGTYTLVYAALIALPPDDLRSARAIQSAWRTLAGNGSTRMVPPPVSVTVRPDARPGISTSGDADASPYGSSADFDNFWNTSGKLDQALLVGSPNPFRDAIAIDYEIPELVVDEDGVQHTLSGEAVETSVRVYNVTGRLVATLVESAHAPGKYRTGWSAQNDQGATVASGVYYVKLQIGKRSVTQRMVQLK
jgi:FlgD Ig-like domain